MLAFKSVVLDDTRICSPICHAASVAIWDGSVPGLPLEHFPAVHADPACRQEVPFPLPYMPARRGREWLTQGRP